MTANKVPISAIVLTFNEDKNIEDCLKSLCNWVEEIFIVDSGSNDRTLEIVKKYTDKIVHHPFKTHALQWIWTIKTLPIKNEWVIGLDADQSISAELSKEIVDLFSVSMPDVDGYYLRRRQYFMGRWIRHGGYYPRYLLKLFKIGKVVIDENELMDHHFYVASKTARLKNDFIEDNRKETLDFLIAKHNKYASLQAKEELLYICRPAIKLSLLGNQDQRRLFIKTLWIHLPLFVRSFIYFVYRYFFKLGFLDGKEGLIWHFLQGFWYRFLVDAKIHEILMKAKKEGKTAKEIISELYGIES